MKYNIGDRVEVSSEGGWKNSFIGTVSSEPQLIYTSMGSDLIYLVEFDEPQQNINGPEDYYKAQILSCYISRLIL